MKTSFTITPERKKTYKKPVLKLHGSVAKLTKLGKAGSAQDLGATFDWAD